MKPEPLKNYDYHDKEGKLYYDKRIKSAVEWYLKYKDNQKLFNKDYDNERCIYFFKTATPLLYDEWLLTKAFEDVMEK